MTCRKLRKKNDVLLQKIRVRCTGRLHQLSFFKSGRVVLHDHGRDEGEAVMESLTGKKCRCREVKEQYYKACRLPYHSYKDARALLPAKLRDTVDRRRNDRQLRRNRRLTEHCEGIENTLTAELSYPQDFDRLVLDIEKCVRHLVSRRLCYDLPISCEIDSFCDHYLYDGTLSPVPIPALMYSSDKITEGTMYKAHEAATAHSYGTGIVKRICIDTHVTVVAYAIAFAKTRGIALYREDGKGLGQIAVLALAHLSDEDIAEHELIEHEVPAVVGRRHDSLPIIEPACCTLVKVGQNWIVYRWLDDVEKVRIIGFEDRRRAFPTMSKSPPMRGMVDYYNADGWSRESAAPTYLADEES